MKYLVFNHDPKLLPPSRDDLLPVQLYGLSGGDRGDISLIGNPVIEKVKRLGVKIPSEVMDFMTISLAVAAADTFVRRSDADDGWARQFSLQLPLIEPTRWQKLKDDLQRALHFLSGDIWEFSFTEGGCDSPEPYSKRDRYRLVRLNGLDCVSLFSGGLDSAIGAIDLLADDRRPLLVSHAYKGDKKHQDQIADRLKGEYSRFEVNADPHLAVGESDISMRTRSLTFLAFAAVGAIAVRDGSQLDSVDLFVPENGFISLNAPLTSRRLGTLSTRTTHPFFIESIQRIFDTLRIPVTIRNPYQFKTKGQMALGCVDRPMLLNVVDSTVSCSHWKRSNQQCGVCVPCIIRRAALHRIGIQEQVKYKFEGLERILHEPNRRDDLQALSIAVAQKATRRSASWILESGPIRSESIARFENVFLEGLQEVEAFLQTQGVM